MFWSLQGFIHKRFFVQTMKKPHIVYHRDGSIWAKGEMDGEVLEGYWEWFRKNGTKMRSGHFRKGKQVGEWVTYDIHGKPKKTTSFDPKEK